MKRLQDVLAALSDEEAMAVWHALSAHVENEQCNDMVEDPTGGPCEAVVKRLDAVIANIAN